MRKRVAKAERIANDVRLLNTPMTASMPTYASIAIGTTMAGTARVKKTDLPKIATSNKCE